MAFICGLSHPLDPRLNLVCGRYLSACHFSALFAFGLRFIHVDPAIRGLKFPEFR
jgi:hypothetical protein